MALFIAQILGNQVLWAALVPWALAQIIKPPLNYVMHHEWDWHLLLASGGMPSSHTALVTGALMGVGLHDGFNAPLFAVAFALAMIVVYDATGVRRHAGDHARVINLMISELLTGHPLAEKELKEVLGHTPREVLGGIIMGMVVAFLMLRVF